MPRLSNVWVIALAAGCIFAAEDAPGWIKELASTPVTGYPAKVNSVMLLNEESNAVDGSGKIIRTSRSVVKYIARQADVQDDEPIIRGNGAALPEKHMDQIPSKSIQRDLNSAQFQRNHNNDKKNDGKNATAKQ